MNLPCFYEKNYQRLYILEADPALWKGGGAINACKTRYLPKNMHVFRAFNLSGHLIF